MMFISCNSSMTHATSGEVTNYPSGGLSVGHVALSLVLCIVLCFFKLCSIVDSLKHVFCDNTIEKQLVDTRTFIFHSMVYYYFS
jgi:hypothetical protein